MQVDHLSPYLKHILHVDLSKIPVSTRYRNLVYFPALDHLKRDFQEPPAKMFFWKGKVRARSFSYISIQWRKQNSNYWIIQLSSRNVHQIESKYAITLQSFWVITSRAVEQKIIGQMLDDYGPYSTSDEDELDHIASNASSSRDRNWVLSQYPLKASTIENIAKKSMRATLFEFWDSSNYPAF